MFREGGENLKIISHGRARKNEPKSHENLRDREFLLYSAVYNDVDVGDDDQC